MPLLLCRWLILREVNSAYLQLVQSVDDLAADGVNSVIVIPFIWCARVTMATSVASDNSISSCKRRDPVRDPVVPDARMSTESVLGENGLSW